MACHAAALYTVRDSRGNPVRVGSAHDGRGGIVPTATIEVALYEDLRPEGERKGAPKNELQVTPIVPGSWYQTSHAPPGVGKAHSLAVTEENQTLRARVSHWPQTGFWSKNGRTGPVRPATSPRRGGNASRDDLVDRKPRPDG